jgi:hypothetical protein
MPDEKPAQVAAGNTQALGQGIDRAIRPIKSAFLDDQSHCAFDSSQTALPGRAKRGRLGAATQAGPIPGSFSCRGARQELDVTAKRQPNGADAAAVDPCRPDADEKSAVERWIAREPRPLEHRLIVRAHRQHIAQLYAAREDEVRFRPD